MCKSSVRFVLLTFVMIITAGTAAAIARAGDDPIGKLGEAPIAEPADIRIAQIISALKKEETKYQNIEYQFRIVTRKYLREFPDELADQKFEQGVLREPLAEGRAICKDRRKVVLQGDNLRFEEEIVKLFGKMERKIVEISAFDGVKTRTVRPGLFANIHIGRFEHPDLYPPHSLPFVHYFVNFPLSVYLSGTKAIQDHPKAVRYEQKWGSAREFIEVKSKFEREEFVNGLRCWKIRCDRKLRKDGPPMLHYLWLARSRNLMCMKEVLSWPGTDTRELPLHESRVERMREITPGVWFPTVIVVERYDEQALRQNIKRVETVDETVVESVNLSPGHERAYFSEVEIPADLPTFVIHDGALEGSAGPEPVAGIDEAGELKKIVAKIETEERKYHDLEVHAIFTYNYYRLRDKWGELLEGTTFHDEHKERSIAKNDKMFFSSDEKSISNPSHINYNYRTRASDGSWVRSYSYWHEEGEKQFRSSSLRKESRRKAQSDRDGFELFRPHTFLIRQDFSSSLSDFIQAKWLHFAMNRTMKFHYCGEESIDGLRCLKISEFIYDQENVPAPYAYVYWLAVDRNYIPIRSECYPVDPKRKLMPSTIGRCDDLREIAPGLWFPFRTTNIVFEDCDAVPSRLVVEQKHEYLIESVKIAPIVDDSIFHDVVVPAETVVWVCDEEGNSIGNYRQRADGIPEITPRLYRQFQAQAKLQKQKMDSLETAIKATIHKPAADFPKNAQWLGGDPLDWKTLRGKVVILVFWAEWCGPCRSELATTEHIHRNRANNGLTVVGIHPPGSELEDVKKVIDEFHLDYPICIDVPPQAGVESWGEIFGKFAVFEIPRAVLVNADGVVIAAGEFNEVVSKASDLVKKK